MGNQPQVVNNQDTTIMSKGRGKEKKGKKRRK